MIVSSGAAAVWEVEVQVEEQLLQWLSPGECDGLQRVLWDQLLQHLSPDQDGGAPAPVDPVTQT